MVAEIKCGMLIGIHGKIVTVQSDISDGLPVFQIIGNVSSEVREAKDRVRTALKNTGYYLPVKRIAVNIAPGDFKKTGVYFDTAIAVAILSSLGILPDRRWEEILILGELSLDGKILPVHGVLPILYEALQQGITKCFIPKANLAEGELLEEIEVCGFEKLSDVISYLQGNEEAACYELEEERRFEAYPEQSIPDFSEIKGQDMAKRAATIMAAGFHNMLLEGEPGAGKSMIAMALPGIMPPLTWKEKMEVLMIHSAGRILNHQSLQTNQRPCRAPGMGITPAGLLGGGRTCVPGEVTLAHHGVLFLDEAAELKPQILELLRTPLEAHKITIHSREESVEFPADFAFICATNPCPCGYYPNRDKCRCSEYQVRRYRARISGPIRDRIDLFVHCDVPDFEHLMQSGKGKSSQEIRQEVEQVWRIQRERQGAVWNGRLNSKEIERFCVLDEKGKQFMKDAYQTFELTGRSYYKVLRLARTIADLRDSEPIEIQDLQEALQYRMSGK